MKLKLLVAQSMPARFLCPWSSPGKNTGSRWPFPSPGDLPHPGIIPRSPALQVESLPSEPRRKPPSKPFTWLSLKCALNLVLPSTKLLNSSMSGNYLCLLPGIDNCTKMCYLFQASLPTMRLGWKDPLEKEMAIHTNILAWRIPWTEEPGGLRSTELQRGRYDWAATLFSSKYVVLTFNLLMLLLDLQRLETKWQKWGKNTSQFINLVFTCSLFLPKFELPSFFIWNTTASYLECML